MGNSGGGGARWANETIPLRVLPVDDPPELHGAATFGRDEIFDSTVSWNESVFYSQSSGLHRLTLSSVHGAVMLMTTRGLSISNIPNTSEEHTRLSQLPIDGSSYERKSYTGVSGLNDEGANAKYTSSNTYIWWKRVTVEGRLDHLNRAIAQVVYQPDINWNSAINDEFDIFNITVEDLGNASNLMSVSRTLQIDVAPVLDQPVLTVPGQIYDSHRLTPDKLSSQVIDTNVLYIDEDSGMFTIEGCSLRSIDSIDGDKFLALFINATYGSIKLVSLIEDSIASGSGSLDGFEGVIVDQYDDTTVALRAPLSVVNIALEKIGFTPTPNYNGPLASVRISVAHSHEAGALTHLDHDALMASGLADSRYLRIYVYQKNDPPSIDVGDELYGTSLFTVPEGETIRLDGVKNLNLNNYVVGSGYDSRASSGYELWKFGEDIASTEKAFDPSSHIVGSLEWSSGAVSDVYPGELSSSPRFLVNYKDFVYFQADDGVHGTELWRQGGSRSPVDSVAIGDADTVLGNAAAIFADLNPGHASSEVSHMAVHNGYLFFSADGVDTNWRLTPDRYDACDGFRRSSFDSRVYYAVSESNVWNKRRRYDCPTGFKWASTAEAHRFFTSKYDHKHDHMWHSYGYSEAGLRHGIQEFRDHGEFERATAVGHDFEATSYMNQCGWEGYEWGAKRRTHFLFSDSHVTGEYKHAGRGDSFRPGVMTVSELEQEAFAGIICVENAAGTAAKKSGQELWRTDGSFEGTIRLDDVYEGSMGSFPKYLTSFGEYLYFSAYTRAEGRELWRTRGSDFGQAELVSLSSSGINPGVSGSDPTDLTVSGDYLFFAATNQDHGTELWLTFQPGRGGMAESRSGEMRTLLLIDIAPGKVSSSPLGFESARDSSGNISLPVYFSASLSSSGRELWRSDGTSEGTYLVRDINPGMSDSYPRYLTWFRGRLYFQATDGEHGRELFVSDGSHDGTFMLKDIRPGVSSSSPSYMTALSLLLPGRLGHRNQHDDEYLYFIATDGLYVKGRESLEGFGGSQLWRTDGTAAGTRRAFQRTQNDLYFDHESLNLAYPARMLAREHELFVPASRGGVVVQGVMSREGFHAQSEEALLGIDQAAVVSDIDSRADDLLTLQLSVNKGYLVLPAIEQRLSPVYEESVQTTVTTNEDGSSSSVTTGALKVLVVDNEISNRILLSVVLSGLGHEVTVASSGVEAYEKITLGAESGEPYHLVLLDMQLPGWDGRQVARMVRHWEHEHMRDRVVLVGTGSSVSLQREREAALEAGLDGFFQRPFKNYESGQLERVDWTTIFDEKGRYINRRSSKSLDLFQEEQERSAYEAFVGRILSFLREARSLQEIVSWTAEPLQATTLTPLPSEEVLRQLPGSLVSSRFELEGTVSDLNAVLRTVYFFAPNGTLTVGDAVFTLTATDRLVPCTDASGGEVSLSLRDAPNSTLLSTCNIRDVAGSGSAEVRIVVTGKNQAPQVLLHSTLPLSAALNSELVVDFLSVDDPDFGDVISLTDSFGFEQLPPVTVSLFCDLGYLSFLETEEVSVLTMLQGEAKVRHLEVYGPIDKVNAALATLRYQCRSIDGCFSGFVDALHVEISDGGYSGQGGALSASLHVPIAIAVGLNGIKL